MKRQPRAISGRQLTPLGERGRAVLLEDVAAGEVAVVGVVVVDRSMDGREFLQGLDVPEFFLGVVTDQCKFEQPEDGLFAPQAVGIKRGGFCASRRSLEGLVR